MSAPKTGALLINLGTPDAPRVPEVRGYLAAFLSDRRVIDLHPLLRWLLLHLIILRRRPRRSAAAYQAIWTPEGSPLRVHGEALVRGVAQALPDLEVVLAMRYGRPSIAAGLDRLQEAGCERVIVFPLYPQQASSTTGSTLERIYRLAARRWRVPALVVVPAFHADPGFLSAQAQVARPVLDELRPDHLLLSFHGLPERHLRRADRRRGGCLQGDDCCAALGVGNGWCYRAQCFATARGIVQALGWAPQAWSVAFQSRLGRAAWIGPHTDAVVADLAASGVRRLAVLCPAFVADCLETLEEIGRRAAETFRAHGGEVLRLVPSLNSHPSWVRAAAALVERAAGN